MGIATQRSTLTTLQNAQAGAANGVAMDISEARAVIVEISGTYTGITANFEGSIDGGTTWFNVSLAQLASLTLVRLAAATAAGFYFLENASGMNAFRARTTVATPTGAMTVRAISSY
jgi:hypothetical protein